MTNSHDHVQDPSYFRGILDNMNIPELGPKENLWARTGNSSSNTGKRPNYQIHTLDGQVQRFFGSNHKPYHELPSESFNPDNLSDEILTYPDLVKLFARLQK